MRGIAGRVALVTGAGGGIGRATAHRLAGEGAAVVVNDLDRDAALGTARAITERGGRAVAAAGDVADVRACEAAVAAAEEHYGGLDILVNNAGFTADAWITRMSDDAWSGVLDVMLTGPFQLCRAAARLLRRPGGAGGGHHRKVVNVSSVNGIYGAAGQVNYSAAKAGLIGLTRALAREWAGQAINVNAVAPGYITGTRLTAPREDGAGLTQDMIDTLERSMPLGRAGTPEEVASAIAFLASGESDFIVGQVLEIHGGREIIAPT